MTHWQQTLYSLCPKMIVQPPNFFPPKMVVGVSAQLRNLRLKVKHFHAKISIARSLSTPQLPGVFQSECWFQFKSHTQNYLVNGQHAFISSKAKNQHNQSLWDGGSNDFGMNSKFILCGIHLDFLETRERTQISMSQIHPGSLR